MIESLLPIALYAETHFRFFGWTPSALFRREPEIVFDMPRRLAAGRDLPVALTVNDIHLYPIHIDSIQIAVSREGKKPRLFDFDRGILEGSLIGHPVSGQMSAYLMTIPRAELADGEVFVNACLRYRRVKNGVAGKKVYTVLNDNIVTSTKYSFRCAIGGDRYPGDNLCTFGDLHCHSQFSRSHVEFGPPPAVTLAMASASGLRFAAVTDHSYDLACDPGDFLRQDKSLRLWEMYKSSIANCGSRTDASQLSQDNRRNSFIDNDYRGGSAVLIPGEEISVLNKKGKVVHLCGLGLSEYIPGTLDGARKNVHFKKQPTIEEAVDEIERQGGVSFAAHPGSRPGLLQGIILKRGFWSAGDLYEKLGGVQAANGDFLDSWLRGKALWINMLQRGLKTPLLAGSDAHGDFNRYRAVSVPFLQICEEADRYMGSARTGVYGKRDGVKDIIGGIKDGATFVTNGPFVTICDGNHPEISLISKKPVVDTANLAARAVSTPEFGPLDVIKVVMGHKGTRGLADEKVVVRQTLPGDAYEVTVPIPADAVEGNCYLRAEVYGKTPRGLVTTAVTSACFVGY